MGWKQKKQFWCWLWQLGVLLCFGMAQANTITGGFFHFIEALVNSATGATIGNVPGTTPDVTFAVNSPFNFSGTGATVAAWLASSLASNIVENTSGTLTLSMDNFTDRHHPRIYRIYLTVTNGQTFTVTHDDGLTLIIKGLTLVDSPGPTPPSTTTVTYTGNRVTSRLTLVYSECCSGPAVLQVASFH